MDEIWVGFSVASEVVVVGLNFHDDTVEVVEDVTWTLQQGDRADAYRVMHDRIHNYLTEREIKHVAIKGSVVPSHATTLAHLHAAELRGVVTVAAAHSDADIKVITKASISRSFGKRKVDEYVADDNFWNEALATQVKKGSRETALVILAARKP